MNDALFDAKLKEALLACGHHGLRRGAVGAGGDGVALNAALPQAQRKKMLATRISGARNT